MQQPGARDSRKVADDKGKGFGRAAARHEAASGAHDEPGFGREGDHMGEDPAGLQINYSAKGSLSRPPPTSEGSQQYSQAGRPPDPTPHNNQGDDCREGEMTSGQPSTTHGRGAVPGPARLHPRGVPARPFASSTQAQPPFCARPWKLGWREKKRRRTPRAMGADEPDFKYTTNVPRQQKSDRSCLRDRRREPTRPPP